MINRRKVLAGSALLLAPATARAAEWPERPIRMIIPFAPGAGADIVGRTFAEELAKALGQPVIVDNKGGAGGLHGDRRRRSRAGRRLHPAADLAGHDGVQPRPLQDAGLRSAQGLRRRSPSPAPCPTCWSSRATNPATTVADLVAQARAKPGELTYGSSGVGSSIHMSGVIFEQRTGVRLQHVPYRGAPAAVLAVINGEVTMGFFNTPTVVPPDQGRQAQGAGRHQQGPLALLPDVPTMMQAGVPDFDVAVWLGLAVPAGTPAPIVTRFNTEINRISQNPQIREKLLAQGFEMLPPDTPAAARKTIVDDQAFWLPIIEKSGAKPE